MKRLKILSLGLGQQSVALYFMSCFGDVTKFDYAIFADPGAEKRKTYEYLEFLLNWQKENNGIPIIWRKGKNITDDLTNSNVKRFASIPAFTKSDNKVGMLKRQCTGEYKIIEVQKAIKDLYKLKKYQRMPLTRVYMGISLDEIERAKFSQNKWQLSFYPLIGYYSNTFNAFKIKGKNIKLTRQGCVDYLIEKGLPVPIKSSCKFCPFQSDYQWNQQKNEEPLEFLESVEIDNKIRNSSNKGIKKPIYLHNSLLPLNEINFTNNQIDMFGSCESGICGT